MIAIHHFCPVSVYMYKLMYVDLELLTLHTPVLLPVKLKLKS